jgi:hypothetical protein
MLRQTDALAEKTLYPIQEFAPQETMEEEMMLSKKGKKKSKGKQLESNDSGDENQMNTEAQALEDKKVSDEQADLLAKKQIQKMEQEALKQEIDSLFAKIVSGEVQGALGGGSKGGSKSSKRSSSKNSQLSKKENNKK